MRGPSGLQARLSLMILFLSGGSPTARVHWETSHPEAGQTPGARCFSARSLLLAGPAPPGRDPDDQYKLTEDTRQLGLVVCRGTSVVLICPQDGMEAIPNPFIQQQDA
ncbi:U6 snRNA-associated Sm-like protein LSm7 isoform X1 [Hyaena hyaena]|uniref:U6 snRNA-associated Sm-like protein LSm7 isoform X1 n=1 Tax=Hyaena hyaena TaxID=95912 RepID=UPI001920EEBB|nr:U6 snRNA-associated Sm-like protein LSm7 isoform X1 [Hyaena hyaena]